MTAWKPVRPGCGSMAAKSERSDSDLEGRAGGTRVAHRSCFAVAASGPPAESVRSQRLDENYEWRATTGRRGTTALHRGEPNPALPFEENRCVVHNAEHQGLVRENGSNRIAKAGVPADVGESLSSDPVRRTSTASRHPVRTASA
jgi:hypothetical protein